MGNEEVDFTLIYTSTKPLEIAAAISLLEEQEIPAYKINKKDSSYIFGEIELYVSADLVDRAKLILTENDLL
ncbi:MAG: DUF2007 domain-containing protein [Bacteroidetes bacterium]|nr:DUF2007 domain-containing protein [Bacteroidota bacterium]